MAYRWLRPVIPAGALLVVLLAAFLALSSPVHADPNELSILPSGVELAPGGFTQVSLVADTPAQTLAVWTIDVAFDPDVVTTESTDCDPLDQPPDSTMVGFCLVDDLDDDGVNDTVRDVFAFINNDDGSGLTGVVVLADITFEAVGDPGDCTDLVLRARIHADSEGDETNPLLFDGRICIEQDAPPSGTAVPHTPAPHTSEPTEPPGGGGQTPGPGETLAPGVTGGETPGGGPDGPGTGQTAGSTGSPGEGASTASASGGAGDDDDGGGPGIVFWVVIGVGVLFVAGAAAWAIARNLGRRAGAP